MRPIVMRGSPRVKDRKRDTDPAHSSFADPQAVPW